MAIMTLGSVGDALYMMISVVFGRHSVRFVQRPPDHKLLRDLAALVESGAAVPIVDSLYSPDQIAFAHRSIEAGGGFGKRILQQDAPGGLNKTTLSEWLSRVPTKKG